MALNRRTAARTFRDDLDRRAVVLAGVAAARDGG